MRLQHYAVDRGKLSQQFFQARHGNSELAGQNRIGWTPAVVEQTSNDGVMQSPEPRFGVHFALHS